MPIVRRIYVSLPADPWLPDNLNRLFQAPQEHQSQPKYPERMLLLTLQM